MCRVYVCSHTSISSIRACCKPGRLALRTTTLAVCSLWTGSHLRAHSSKHRIAPAHVHGTNNVTCPLPRNNNSSNNSRAVTRVNRNNTRTTNSTSNINNNSSSSRATDREAGVRMCPHPAHRKHSPNRHSRDRTSDIQPSNRQSDPVIPPPTRTMPISAVVGLAKVSVHTYMLI